MLACRTKNAGNTAALATRHTQAVITSRLRRKLLIFGTMLSLLVVPLCRQPP